MIKCVNTSCEEFLSKVLARGVARETPDRILLWVWAHVLLSVFFNNFNNLFVLCRHNSI